MREGLGQDQRRQQRRRVDVAPEQAANQAMNHGDQRSDERLGRLHILAGSAKYHPVFSATAHQVRRRLLGRRDAALSRATGVRVRQIPRPSLLIGEHTQRRDEERAGALSEGELEDAGVEDLPGAGLLHLLEVAL